MVDGGVQTVPSPGSSQTHPRSHQPIRGPSPLTQRSAGAPWQVGTCGKDSEELTSSLGPAQGWSQGRASASRQGTRQDESVLGCLWDFRVLLPRGVGRIIGMQEKHILRLCKAYYGMCRAGTKGRERDGFR